MMNIRVINITGNTTVNGSLVGFIQTGDSYALVYDTAAMGTISISSLQLDLQIDNVSSIKFLNKDYIVVQS